MDWKNLLGSLPESMNDRLRSAVFANAEEPSEDANDVAIHEGFFSVEGNRSDRARRVGANPLETSQALRGGSGDGKMATR